MHQRESRHHESSQGEIHTGSGHQAGRRGVLRKAPAVLPNLCSLYPVFWCAVHLCLLLGYVVSVRRVTRTMYPTEHQALTSVLNHTHWQCSTIAKIT